MSAQKFHQQAVREAQAHAEVGQTAIGRGAAWSLCLGFMALILVVPVFQMASTVRGVRTGTHPAPVVRARESARRWRGALRAAADRETLPERLMALNREVLRGLQTFEDDLEDASVVGHVLRPRLQLFFADRLGIGNEQVIVGRNGHLFFRPDFDAVTGSGFLDPARLAARALTGDEWAPPPAPDPRPAIRAFHRDLAARGVALILVPTPLKPSVDPGHLALRPVDPDAMPRNADFRRMVEELEADGIVFFDVATVLARHAPADGRSRYLRTDTHWRPETMQQVAHALAAAIRARFDLPAVSAPVRRRAPTTVAGVGDLVRMFDLPAGHKAFPAETVTIEPVFGDDGQYWRADPAADVLLLGDSFSNMFSFEPMGWGESAGFAEHLSLALGRPLDRIVRNDDGAAATRAMLAAELARGHDRLAGKRLVVWQFAERELVHGDWRRLPLRLASPPPSRFVAPAEGETLEVRGIVQDVAAAPRPGTVPYRDHVVAMHLVDIEHPRGDIAGGEALVYLWSMRDNQWTRAARLRRGQTVRVRLSGWDTVAETVSALNRAELDDIQLQLETPVWGELRE